MSEDGSNFLIGIVGEAATDLQVIEVLVERILSDLNANQLTFNSKKCRTAIEAHFVRMHLKLFFEGGDPQPDLVVFITDQDQVLESRKDLIQREILSYNAAQEANTVVAAIRPHMESWLVADQNTLKQLFNYPRTRALPSKESPKELLITLIGDQQGEGTLSQQECYSELARNMDLRLLQATHRDFEDFRSELRRKYSHLTQSDQGLLL